MTPEALIEVLRAHLSKSCLVICKVSAGFPLMPIDGLEESQALRDVVDVLDDASNVAEWDGSEDTTPVHSEVLAALARAS